MTLLLHFVVLSVACVKRPDLLSGLSLFPRGREGEGRRALRPEQRAPETFPRLPERFRGVQGLSKAPGTQFGSRAAMTMLKQTERYLVPGGRRGIVPSLLVARNILPRSTPLRS